MVDTTPDVGIGLMFLVAGIGVLAVLTRFYLKRSWEDNTRQYRRELRERGLSEDMAENPPFPGFRWLWDKKFQRKQVVVQEMLSRHLKLLHVMSSVQYQKKEDSEIYDSWNDVASYMTGNPICTSVLPAKEDIVQRRLFLFDTLRYLRMVKDRQPERRMDAWLSEFESIFLLGVLQVDAWKVYLDSFRRLALGTPWLKVWNYRPREHLDFLFMPLVTPSGGKTGMMGRFVISFSDVMLLETTKAKPENTWKAMLKKYWEKYSPLSDGGGSNLDWIDLAIDQKKYCESAPPCVPSEQLLLDSSNLSFTRALVHKKMIVLDIRHPEGCDMSFDITSSDLAIHIGLLPLLHKPKEAPIPMEVVLLLFRKSVQSWKGFKEAFAEHVSALKSYIYDNRAQKAMIDTIMSTLKLTHSLGTVSEHNIMILAKFLEKNTKTIDGNISAFWSWETQPPTLQERWPEIAHDLEKFSEFFTTTYNETKEWDKDLREMMQMVFNLVSIDEAYRSREQAVSLKRMSWITFIFLPLLFAASLFGMNVDLLDENPSWTWYLVVCVPSLCVVWGVWFAYRISDYRRSVLEETPFKSA